MTKTMKADFDVGNTATNAAGARSMKPGNAAKRGPQRLSVSVTGPQHDALEKLAITTGLQKADLIREAIGLLTVARTAWSKNLELAIVDDNDRVLKTIISSNG
jgi:hypothetical protein